MDTLKADLCLPLLNLKMSVTITSWGFLWKYKRFARKTQINAIVNQIILKTLTWGQLPIVSRHCR